MTAPKRYTEREMVLAKREASAKARCAALWSELRTEPHIAWLRDTACGECSAKAAERYPFPKIERPRRRVDIVGIWWRVVDGAIQWTDRPNDWQTLDDARTRMWLSHERVVIIAGLLDRPTELVDDDGSVSDTPPAGAET